MKWLDKKIDKYFARKAIQLVSQKLNMVFFKKEIIESPDSYYLMIGNNKFEYRTRFVEIMFKDGLEAYTHYNEMTDLTICRNAETLLEEMNNFVEKKRAKKSKNGS